MWPHPGLAGSFGRTAPTSPQARADDSSCTGDQRSSVHANSLIKRNRASKYSNRGNREFHSDLNSQKWRRASSVSCEDGMPNEMTPCVRKGSEACAFTCICRTFPELKKRPTAESVAVVPSWAARTATDGARGRHGCHETGADAQFDIVNRSMMSTKRVVFNVVTRPSPAMPPVAVHAIGARRHTTMVDVSSPTAPARNGSLHRSSQCDRWTGKRHALRPAERPSLRLR